MQIYRSQVEFLISTRLFDTAYADMITGHRTQSKNLTSWEELNKQ